MCSEFRPEKKWCNCVHWSTLECVLMLACLFEVLEAHFIHREEAYGGTIFRTHVGDGSSVSNRELCDTRTIELHKLSHNTNLTQMLLIKDTVHVHMYDNSSYTLYMIFTHTHTHTHTHSGNMGNPEINGTYTYTCRTIKLHQQSIVSSQMDTTIQELNFGDLDYTALSPGSSMERKRDWNIKCWNDTRTKVWSI